MTGQTTPAQLAAFLIGLAMKGERPGRDRRARADDARACGEALAPVPGVIRYVRHGGRWRRHDQCVVGRRSRHGRMRRRRRQARQPVGVEPLRQCRRARGARRHAGRHAGGRRAQPERGRPGVSFRAGVSSVDEARGADAARAWPPHRLQPSWPADQPGRDRRVRSSASPGPSSPSSSRARS